MTSQRNPWLALTALVVGFFMILLDMTIVAVANPAIMQDLHTDINKVIWVTSAYLLTYAVPLLVTGRLGDRFGPKNIYLAGLAVFTLASLWCAVSANVEMLIAARAVQGLGAALMTPQTMAVITRTFPPDKRGAAMGLWGGVAGLATLVGPILGGVLVDWQGWNWIFYINVPIGVVAFALAVWLVPNLETHQHKFDFVGVVLSGIGMFLLVFGIQEGNTRDWDAWIWAMIIAGLVVLGLFVVNQARNKDEPLVPLSLFRDRNFDVERRDRRDGRRGHLADGAGVLLPGGGARVHPDPGRAGLRADGDRHRPDRAVHRQDLRPDAAAHPAHHRIPGVRPDRLRLRGADEAGQLHRGIPGGRGRRRSVELLHLGSAGLHRHPQPADSSGGRRCGCLQHHPSGRFGAR